MKLMNTPSQNDLEQQTGGGSGAAACSAPFGEFGEEYYCKRDDFVRHIAEQVNPARLSAGLNALDETTAAVCFRILNDFARASLNRTAPNARSAADRDNNQPHETDGNSTN